MSILPRAQVQVSAGAADAAGAASVGAAGATGAAGAADIESIEFNNIYIVAPLKSYNFNFYICSIDLIY
jgi:hypothetical protein